MNAPTFAQDAPAHALDGFHAEFAEFARWMLDERRRAWPAMVDAGKMTEQVRAQRYRMMEAIEAIWLGAADLGEAGWLYAFNDIGRDDLLVELATTIKGAQAKREAAPDDRLAADRHEALLAMHWWISRFADRRNFVICRALTLRADTIDLQLAFAAQRDGTAERKAA
ncbi:hypothetical protein [Sphingomonas montanisoli]|uniref:Uncharacterized protein n=1 Tax=Sphingomonas montanisoli TaxID=2606412 RepID=A0A5D9C470_9SPHN|nr:hypothetical protein [Sphingomonas montanisoli]TZG26479.1 hypothetical protein FYJ91_16275 [Sphingomonas montanisoli]